jgi:hypothetical protein
VLLQLIRGEFDAVTVASDDVAIGPTTGDVTLHAQGVAIRGDAAAEAATAMLAIDEAELRTLLSTVDGFPADTVGLADPDITMSVELQFFALTFPVGVALTPSAVDGDIVLSPASLQLGDAEVTAEELTDRFGSLADVVLRDWEICIAQHIPAGLTLTSTAVDGPAFVADFAIDTAIVNDPALQANGSCD